MPKCQLSCHSSVTNEMVLVWGGSLVPVFGMLIIRPHCYDGQRDVCWMDFQSFYYAVAIPIGAMLLINFVIFGLIVYSLHFGSREEIRNNEPEERRAKRRSRNTVLACFLLGLPWVFGFLSIREARLVFSLLFCIFSMLQGEISTVITPSPTCDLILSNMLSCRL